MGCEFMERLEKRWKAGQLISVGLDAEFARLPESLKQEHPSPEEALFVFNRSIIDATADFACAFKPNSAFYEAEGEGGWRVLGRTAHYLHEQYPEIPLILDAKRADIGSTNEAYARAIFDDLGMDAVTVHPYLGKEALQPFLDRRDNGIFVLVRTSNPGAGEFQDLKNQNGTPLYQTVARQVAETWNTNGNCGVVVGATYPEELKIVRTLVGGMPVLVPGIGIQGGDVGKTVSAGKAAKNIGLLINSSRGIIYASSGGDFADAARKAAESLSNDIKKFL